MRLDLTALHPRLTLPNLLTGSRFAAAPILLWLAWHGYGDAFLILLGFAFLTDALDGPVARMTRQVTRFGAELDSHADMAIYLAIGFGTWWLWRDIVHRQDIYLYAIVACFLLPLIYSHIKFGQSASYHTRLTKVSAVCIAISLYPLFLAEIVWPFRLAVVIYIITAIEQIAITCMIETPRTNVHSLMQLLKERNRV